MVKTFDKQTGFIPHRKAYGAQRPGHPFGTQSLLSTVDESGRDRRIFRFEQPPITTSRAHALFRRLLQCQVIDMGGDAANDLPATFGQK